MNMLYFKKFCFVTEVHQAECAQKMGRLSEDIMAMFGVKPGNQQSSANDHAVSTAPDGISIISYCIIIW